MWLQERGFDVVAVDVSPLVARVAKARRMNLLVSMAAQELAFNSDSLGTILFMGNNFGVCGNVADTERMMKRIHQITSRNGCIITVSHDVPVTSLNI